MALFILFRTKEDRELLEYKYRGILHTVFDLKVKGNVKVCLT